MLIFDRFETMEQARQFALKATAETGLGAVVCESQEESDGIDPFPFELVPPIVLVDRHDSGSVEQLVMRLAPEFGGEFAGT